MGGPGALGLIGQADLLTDLRDRGDLDDLHLTLPLDVLRAS
jgi:hypothetical protein